MKISLEERYKLLCQRIFELEDAFPSDPIVKTLVSFVGLLDSDVFSYNFKGCLIIGDGTPPDEDK